jgi:hypothetical protein
MAKSVTVIEIPEIKKQKLTLNIVGDTGLITHSWAEKAIKEIQDKQSGKPKQGKKENRDPDEDYRASLYWLNKEGELISPLKKDPNEHGMFGFKAIAFKAAAVRAANDVGIPMTLARRWFRVPGEFVPIEFDRIEKRTDSVKIGQGTTDLRYRAEFINWRCKLEIEFNASTTNAAQIVNLFNTAGFGVGVGEWRPEKNGINGTFHVE